VSPKRCKIGPRLPLITNRKSHVRIRCVLKSTTLDEPELTLKGYYALCYIMIIHMFFFRSSHKNSNKDRPITVSTRKFAQGSYSFLQYKVYPDISEGLLEKGRQMKVGSSKMAIFVSFSRYIVRTLNLQI